MARTPFKLKSGNNIKSAFKMMGSSSSPVKKLAPEVYVDDVLVERGSGKGEEAVKEGLNVEEINERKENWNIEANQKAYDQALRNIKDGVDKEQNMAILEKIEKGDFEGGKKLQTVTYTEGDAESRELKRKGLKTGTVEGAFPSEEGKIPVGEDVKTFATDEEYKQWLRTQEVNK